MQDAIAIHRPSINSIASGVALVIALTAGGIGGYWLKSQPPAAKTAATFSANSGPDAVAHSMIRHAFQERTESDLERGLDSVALSMTRHAAQERAEAGQ